MDRHIYKIISAILVASCYLSQNIFVVIIAIALEIAVLIFSIKNAKNNPDDTHIFIMNLLSIIAALIFSMILSIYLILIESSYNNNPNDLSSYLYQELSTEDIAFSAVLIYEQEHKSFFENDKTMLSTIVNNFRKYLVQELGAQNIKSSGTNKNILTCTINNEQVTFVVSKKGITYKVK